MIKKLWLARKSKALFFKWKLHLFFLPVLDVLDLLTFITKLSKWIHEIKKPLFNDFYSSKHDYDKRYTLYQHIIDTERLDQICYLEFGVAQGHSFLWWARHLADANSCFTGFDTFSGLPEKWGIFAKGAMSVHGETPNVNDPRCTFIKGLFQDTLPGFLKTLQPDKRKVIHCDADIYSSTLFVLTSLAPFLRKNDIIIFDEFNVPLHEFRAFMDFTNSYYIKTEMIGAVNNYFQVAFKIVT